MSVGTSLNIGKAQDAVYVLNASDGREVFRKYLPPYSRSPVAFLEPHFFAYSDQNGVYLIRTPECPGNEILQARSALLQQHHRSFGSRPIRVLTSGNHGVGHLEKKPPDTPKHLKYEQETALAQARWLALSSNSKQIFTHNSSEYIQFDEPDTLVSVREVYDHAKRP